MTWPVEILASGNFEVEMYYTCPESLVGSEVELSLGENRVRAVISDKNDPIAVGAKHDRVKRATESFVKDFKPLKLGVIHLDAGRGELTLQASQIASDQGSLEMRLFMFHRVK